MLFFSSFPDQQRDKNEGYTDYADYRASQLYKTIENEICFQGSSTRTNFQVRAGGRKAGSVAQHPDFQAVDSIFPSLERTDITKSIRYARPSAPVSLFRGAMGDNLSLT